MYTLPLTVYICVLTRACVTRGAQKPAGKLTSDVDEQSCDSNTGSADKSAGQSRSGMTVSLPTLKGDAKERIRHASPAMMECDFRAEERHESRDMDIKSRIDFKPRAMRSKFQTNMRR